MKEFGQQKRDKPATLEKNPLEIAWVQDQP
jgi:hypothetical protein